MAVISKPNTFSAGAVIVASEHNANFDTIYSEFNGLITTANISPSAAIVDTQLAQITTANKVNLSALRITSQATGDIIYASSATALARLAVGTATQLLHGGTTPSYSALTIADLPSTRFKIGTLTRDLSAASGAVAYTGVGFTPKIIIFLSNENNTFRASWGFDDGTTAMCVGDDHGVNADSYNISTSGKSINFLLSSGNSQTGAVSALGADGFTITWTKNGTITGTGTVLYLAFA